MTHLLLSLLFLSGNNYRDKYKFYLEFVKTSLISKDCDVFTNFFLKKPYVGTFLTNCESVKDHQTL